MHPLSALAITATILWAVAGTFKEYQQARLLRRMNKEVTRRGYE